MRRASLDMALVLALARVLLGGVFGYAAFSKLVDMRQFAEEIANYQMLPAALVPALAAAVVGVELVCALLLVLGLRARAASLLVALLLLVFIGALSQALLRGINLSCGCFGGADEATWGTVARDVALLLLAALPAWGGAGAMALDDRPR